ncbi:MAG TPA: hypothetical protein VIJ00_17660 [Nakamurella sp.]
MERRPGLDTRRLRLPGAGWTNTTSLPIAVDFGATRDKLPPIVNAVRVTHRPDLTGPDAMPARSGAG